jgi:MbtH protein
MDRYRKEDALLYKVLMNRDAKFSVWPASRAIPVGWRHAGMTALKPECFAFIKSMWGIKPPGSRSKAEG